MGSGVSNSSQSNENNESNHNNLPLNTLTTNENLLNNDFYTIKSQELRITILETIPLIFHRSTTIILYGCKYSRVEMVGEILSKKLNCKILRGINEKNEILLPEQNLFINFPSNFQETLQLQQMTSLNQETYAIFIYSTLTNLLKIIKYKWIHQSSGRRYHLIDNPPKSMTGTIEEPNTMLDDLTNEPLQQVNFFSSFPTFLFFLF